MTILRWITRIALFVLVMGITYKMISDGLHFLLYMHPPAFKVAFVLLAYCIFGVALHRFFQSTYRSISYERALADRLKTMAGRKY